MTVDLHIHSTYSDGTETPGQLVQRAVQKGLKAISITDHDTVEGTVVAMNAGIMKALEVIPGIEFSCVHKSHHMHVLGYYIDPANQDLLSTLNNIQQARIDRNCQIIKRLNGLGIEISMEEVCEKSPIGQTGRPHIAQVLMEKKVIPNIDSAFTRFLKVGKPAYVARKVLQVTETINVIRRAGGVAVLAHPGSIDNSLRKIPAILKELKKAGLQGIEVYYPIHTKRVVKKLKSMADCYDLVVTGGSDYHGSIRPGTDLAGANGFYVPDDIPEQLRIAKDSA
ncbi:PHP domain-containing protein [Desulfopila sp. IMCC35008]|uniref:PHP domain-containing protein n=1 Tax=Desulfopila sp. IMCC35008 TaxID=2653858 RepID=UPI0013D82AFA|nr:PHP domain-containing protein [Desulfopila sp. IMCC35008]